MNTSVLVLEVLLRWRHLLADFKKFPYDNQETCLEATNIVDLIYSDLSSKKPLLSNICIQLSGRSSLGMLLAKCLSVRRKNCSPVGGKSMQNVVKVQRNNLVVVRSWKRNQVLLPQKLLYQSGYKKKKKGLELL